MPDVAVRLITVALILLACAGGVRAQDEGGPASRPPEGRVIVIGVDGFDLEICREMIAKGDLPELDALAKLGSFIPLEPTNPAQSPVSWATLTTGLNPGQTGIFDFLRREFREDGGIAAELALSRTTPAWRFGGAGEWVATAGVLAIGGVLALLAFSLTRKRRKVAATASWIAACLFLVPGLVGASSDRVRSAAARAVIPRVPMNARHGKAFWERLDAVGVRTMSVLAPVAFPAPRLRWGHLVSGLGVPDAMGTPGTYTMNREEPVPAGRAVSTTGCRVRQIRDQGGGNLSGITVTGPRRGRRGERDEVPVGARVDRKGRVVTLDLAGQTCSVGERQWSPFLSTDVGLPWFRTMSVLTRFRVIEAGDRVVLHQEPPCFDPRRQPEFAPMTSPIEFGDEICNEGPFDTCGWGCATNPMQDELIDEETFLADIEEIERQRRELLTKTLLVPDWRLFFCVLSTPDRVQHMFWRDRDPLHPRHDPAAVARRGDPIRDCYRRMDALIGRIRREVARPDDLFLVVSDHGFAPFRFSVNLNRFLAEQGFLVGTGDRTERKLETSLGGASLFPGIDWSKTRAYSIGLGKIYVNLATEPGGIVPPGDRRALLEDIRARLLALRHDGAPVVRSAILREDLYRGSHVADSADLVIGFERGFRVSWQCTLGSLDEPVISENRNLWSGDHCSIDPSLVPGVLFSSRPLDQERAGVADVCPTVERALGIEPDPSEDGRPLLFKAR